MTPHSFTSCLGAMLALQSSTSWLFSFSLAIPATRCYLTFFFFSSRRRHTRCSRDWSSDVCSSDLSFVDQATITGESMPAEKIRGTSVYAGTINQSGALEIQVDRMGRDTTFGKIIDAVERAEKSRAPFQGIADRLAGYLVYFALGAAALTFVITDNMRSTISVVIVAGACGIAAGTPLAILGGIGRSAQLGSIIKGGLYLESLATIDTILLDKTGTLTYGTPGVVDVRPADGVPVASLLQAAVTAESRSEHPVAKAILKKASNMGISGEEPERFDYTPGKGIVTAFRGLGIMLGNLRLLLGVRGEFPIK